MGLKSTPKSEHCQISQLLLISMMVWPKPQSWQL